MELCYTNNPRSLFRKYKKLVTWFANTPIGQSYLGLETEVGLLLPHGYTVVLDRNKKITKVQMTVHSQAIYAPKLYPALQLLDMLLFYVKDFKEAQQIFLFGLGLGKMPDVVKTINFASLTVNPNASPESTSTDGYVYNAPGGGASYSTCRSGAGTSANHTGANAGGIAVRHFNNSGSIEMARSVTLFDTSALTASATLVSATASVYVNGKNIDSGKDYNLDLVRAVPASNTTLAASDFNISNWTMTLQSNTEISTASLSIPAYNDFPLNTTGLNNVSLTGISKFGWTTANDRTNTDPSLASGQDERNDITYADNGSNAPKLVITYTLPGGMMSAEI